MNDANNRVISWFSCGAASAYATYLASKKYGDRLEAVYCRVAEESPDNLRFLNEFVNITGIDVKIIGDESKNYSIYEVFRSRKFIKGQTGAPCTMVLKKNVRKAYQRPDDIQIFGYTVDELNRVDRFIDSNNEVDADFILVDNNISKQDCMTWFTSMGFKMPEMYQLGYPNNNCIGCVKGGMGYWNHIRKDFPEHFEKMAKLEREIGHAINKDKNGAVYLDELEPSRGNFKRDVPSDCGFTCEWKN
jgi:PP-loop superfamily ATP-utilizing enzyme